MNANLINIIGKNGYRVYQSDEYFIIRTKIFTSWGLLVLFLILGLCVTLSGLLMLFLLKDWESLVIIAIGSVLLVAPFFNYLTASYRSLVIDRQDKTLLFRSGFSRAYLFTEVKDIKLEVQARQADTNAYSDSNKEFHYTITAYMEKGTTEELISLKFRNEEDERHMFALRDYFQALLTYNS